MIRWREFTLGTFFTLGNLTGVMAEEAACVAWDPVIHGDQDLTIGSIQIEPRNIFDTFDPRENAWFHRLGNDLHISTTPSTVSHQLIFKSGDPLDLRQLNEAERLLRSRHYIKNASIEPIEVCGNRVNVSVKTIDHWTFTPSLSISRVGGKNTATGEIEESNLFGLGKHLVIEYDDGIDRTSRSISYTDPNLFGSHYKMDLSLRNNSDGNGHATSLGLPFYQLDSRQAWNINVAQMGDDISLYRDGEVYNRYHRETDHWNLGYGWSKGLRGNTVDRFQVGWFYNDQVYDGLVDTLPGTVPLQRTLSYPWTSFQHIDERYVEITNLTTMDEIQDVGIGRRYSVLLGAALERFGSDADYAVARLDYSASYQSQPHSLHQVSGSITSLLGNGVQRNDLLKIGFNWYHFRSKRYTYSVSGELAHETHPSPDTQVLLGGDTGMRGYPIRYQEGQEKVLLSAEQRHMYDLYPWRLFQMASAVFADVGSAWNREDNPDWIYDVGIGLRIFPTRSSGKTVAHIDLAFPINAGDDVDSVQFNISTKSGF